MGARGSVMVNQQSEMVPVFGRAMQVIAVSNAVKVLNELSDKCTHVLISLDGGDTRVTFDGTDPTAAAGILYTNKERFLLNRDAAKAAKFIRATADVALHAQEVAWA